MSTHTPGPWFEHSHRQIGPREGIVCEVWSAHGDADAIGQADANAHLIASAPDLLEALNSSIKFIEAMTPYGVNALKKARAAVAKATGADHA